MTLKQALREQNNVYCSAIRQTKINLEKIRREQYVWDGRIHPSSLSSLYMCPKKFYTRVKETKEWPVKTLDKFDAGDAIHEQYQHWAGRVPGLRFNVFPLIRDQELLDKQVEVWPERIFRDPETNWSGRADDMILNKGEVEVVEIKSTSPDEHEWMFNMEEVKEAHLAQGLSYLYHFNRCGYYPGWNFKRMRFVYINLKWEIGKEGFEKEFVVEYAPYKDKIESLVWEHTRQCQAFKDDVDLPCGHRFCKDHAVDG